MEYDEEHNHLFDSTVDSNGDGQVGGSEGLAWLKQWANERYWGAELEDFILRRPEVEIEVVVQGPVRKDPLPSQFRFEQGVNLEFPNVDVMVTFRVNWSAQRCRYAFRFAQAKEHGRYMGEDWWSWRDTEAAAQDAAAIE